MDIRKSLVFALAERGWPLIGMEAMGMSLEDVFISIVNKTDVPERIRMRTGRNRRGRTATDLEQDLAQSILDATAEAQKNIAPYEGDE